MLRLAGLGTYVQTQHDDHEDVVGRGEIDLVHDQDLVLTETRIGVDVGLPGRFGASLMLPVRVVSTSIRYLDTAGMDVELMTPGIHHRNETVSGLGDPMVLGAYTFAVGTLRVTTRAGFTIPIGRTEENPFTRGDMGLRHQHIQMGTGTVNPVLAVEASGAWGAWRLGGFAFTQQVVYENGKGYQGGDRYAGGVTLRRGIGTTWGVRGGVEVQGESAERWGGVIHTDDGNQGRVDGILAAGVSWAASKNLSLDLGIKISVITHVVGGQLDMPAIVELGVAWSFGGKAVAAHDHDHEGEEHEHEHGDEHGDHDEPHTAGLDVADLGTPGEAVDLVPVPGKITIFDFWAVWCEPCKILEPALIEIARGHPDRVAIRRIDAVDWDSAAVARHLTPGGFNLPHLKIFDETGRMVLEQSSATGKLEALIDAVRAIVEPASIPPTPTPAAPAPLPKPSSTPVRARITVTDKGFEPADVVVPRGKPVTLVWERKVDKTCATEVVFELDGKKIVKDLPLNQPTELTLTFPTAGTIRYACAMDMIRGTITVR